MGNLQAKFAKIADGSGIAVSKRVWIALACPKCRKDIDVTNVTFGTVIACPHCKNITWRPEFKPMWYFRVRNFILANLFSFTLGILASLLAAYIYEHSSKPAASAADAALHIKQP